MTPVQQLLTNAADLIEKGWTQGAYARTDKGNPVGLETDNATCFCSIGALARAISTPEFRGAYYKAIDAIEKAVGQNIINWNDEPGRTQAEVVAAFRQAAQLPEVTQ